MFEKVREKVTAPIRRSTDLSILAIVIAFIALIIAAGRRAH